MDCSTVKDTFYHAVPKLQLLFPRTGFLICEICEICGFRSSFQMLDLFVM